MASTVLYTFEPALPRAPRRVIPMPAARAQNLRVLEGRFVLARVTDARAVAFEADLLALVLGPDGGANAARRHGRGRVGSDVERR